MAHALSEDFHCEESHEPDLARGLPKHFAICIYMYIVSVFSTQLCGHSLGCEEKTTTNSVSVPHRFIKLCLSVCMTACALFPRLPWWGRERGGGTGGRGWRGIREEGGGHVCW